jgi:hypothetical protein
MFAQGNHKFFFILISYKRSRFAFANTQQSVNSVARTTGKTGQPQENRLMGIKSILN